MKSLAAGLVLTLALALPALAGPASPAPELDPTALTGGVAVVAAALLLARDNRPSRKH